MCASYFVGRTITDNYQVPADAGRIKIIVSSAGSLCRIFNQCGGAPV